MKFQLQDGNFPLLHVNKYLDRPICVTYSYMDNVINTTLTSVAINQRQVKLSQFNLTLMIFCKKNSGNHICIKPISQLRFELDSTRYEDDSNSSCRIVLKSTRYTRCHEARARIVLVVVACRSVSNRARIELEPQL